MCGGIGKFPDAVSRARQNYAAAHDHGPNRHLAARGSGARLLKRGIHEAGIEV